MKRVRRVSVSEYALWSQPLLPLWQRILLLPLYLMMFAYWCLAGYSIDVKVWKEVDNMVNSRCSICGRWYPVETMIRYKCKTGVCEMCQTCYSHRKNKVEVVNE